MTRLRNYAWLRWSLWLEYPWVFILMPLLQCAICTPVVVIGSWLIDVNVLVGTIVLWFGGCMTIVMIAFALLRLLLLRPDRGQLW